MTAILTGIEHYGTLGILVGSCDNLNIVIAFNDFVSTAGANRLVTAVHSVLENIFNKGVTCCGNGCPIFTVIKKVLAVCIGVHFTALFTSIVSDKAILGTGRIGCSYGNYAMNTVGDWIIILNKNYLAESKYIIYLISVNEYLNFITKCISLVKNYINAYAVIGIFAKYICRSKNCLICGVKPNKTVVNTYERLPLVGHFGVICIGRNLIVAG